MFQCITPHFSYKIRGSLARQTLSRRGAAFGEIEESWISLWWCPMQQRMMATHICSAHLQNGTSWHFSTWPITLLMRQLSSPIPARVFSNMPIPLWLLCYSQDQEYFERRQLSFVIQVWLEITLSNKQTRLEHCVWWSRWGDHMKFMGGTTWNSSLLWVKQTRLLGSY